MPQVHSLLILMLMTSPFSGASKPISEGASDPLIKPYQATYEVYRNGKLRAIQKSKLIKVGDHRYQLTDFTEGTAGLASLLNLERRETTVFEHHNQHNEVINYKLKQSITFNTKTFQFIHKPGSETYQGNDDGTDFTIESQQNLMSSHLMSWQLAQNVCQDQNKFSLGLLKSDQPRTYHFETRAFDNDKTLVARVFDDNPDKSTETWVNHKNGCYVSEINFYDDGERIRTALIDIEFSQP